MQDTNDSTKIPFQKIALSMSGGGYRAAAFHLGSMDYLKRLRLLQNVEMISTVSGGTFTGAMYALCLSEFAQDTALDPQEISDRAFNKTYDRMVTRMKEVDLIEKGLTILAKGSTQSEHNHGREISLHQRSSNLINAMAEVYNTDFFEGKTFGELWKNDDRIHLKDIIFNTTEFCNGLPFRFQKARDPQAAIGNFYLNISVAQAQEVRVADIVAASSCFPVGFEPLRFPDDFCHDESSKLHALKERMCDTEEEYLYPMKATLNPEKCNVSHIGLMDGGIDDNQGILGITLANERNEAEDFPDLFIISDVSSHFMKPYTFPETGKESKALFSLSLNGADRVLWYIQLLLGGLVAGFLVKTILRFTPSLQKLVPAWLNFPLNVGIFACFLTISLAIIYGIRKLRNLVDAGVLDQIPLLGDDAWKYLNKISLQKYGDLLKVRVSSAITMTSDVFMKQIRRLIYSQIYDTPQYGPKEYKPTLLSNLIYSLIPFDVSNRRENKEYLPDFLLNPSQTLMDTCEQAFRVGTTLWFTDLEKDLGKIHDLIACGQATLCFRLLEQINQNYGEEPEKYTPPVRKLYDRLKEDWDGFNQDPYFIIKERENYQETKLHKMALHETREIEVLAKQKLNRTVIALFAHQKYDLEIISDQSNWKLWGASNQGQGNSGGLWKRWLRHPKYHKMALLGDLGPEETILIGEGKKNFSPPCDGELVCYANAIKGFQSWASGSIKLRIRRTA